MASYRLSISPIRAGEGRSPQAASAYINGARADEMSSVQASNAYISGVSMGSHDYTRKRGVLHTEFVGPASYRLDPNEPQRVRFWDDVVRFEKENNRRFYSRKTGNPTATLAREHKVNLPAELDFDSNIKLARAYCLELRRRYGIAGEFAVHAASRNGDKRNIHFHFLHTDRGVSDDGVFAHTKSALSRGDRRTHLKEIREWWAVRVNRELDRKGLSARMDHRSLADRGIDRLPTKHMGPKLTKLERSGIPTFVGEYNRVLLEFQNSQNRKPNEEELKAIRYRASIARRVGELNQETGNHHRDIAERKRVTDFRKRRSIGVSQAIERSVRAIERSIGERIEGFEELDRFIRETVDLAIGLADLVITGGITKRAPHRVRRSI